ncbi:hypothetical protein [Streptomyces mangrovisoli]|uniref:Enoyl-CoA hydratase n=1 Tax=Streptomyces mangrovisoli TaxID=1428628 RepID=A0A1J4P1E0_9ACTN|nr:hypothetical protein [Streptomyces mangrovisoli]OIJ68042.1 hypothetical protein WN71_009570 [Streptomyces mangrovisoli]
MAACDLVVAADHVRFGVPEVRRSLVAADRTLEECWDRQEQIIAAVFASGDAREGVTAFTEKRGPVWRGR